MSATIAADNLGALHAEGPVDVSGNRPRDRVKVCGPAAAGIELVRGLIERGIAAGAGVDALGWIVLVVLTGERRLSPFLTEDPELL